MTKTKRILIIGDMHVGDNVAIMPPEMTEERNGERVHHYANELQLDMYQCWKDMIKNSGKVDTVFNMGDNINGFNYHENGVGNWTNSFITQAEAALKLLRMIKCGRHNMVIGSRYHVGGNPSAEEYIANMMRADGDKVSVGRDLIVKIAGKTFHLLHNIGYTSNVAYRSTPLGRELMFALMRDVELHGTKYLIRGHTHYYQSIMGYNSGACICPSWKLQDDFLKKGSLGGADMRIGYVLCTIDGDHVRFEYNGMKFRSTSEVVKIE